MGSTCPVFNELVPVWVTFVKLNGGFIKDARTFIIALHSNLAFLRVAISAK